MQLILTAAIALSVFALVSGASARENMARAGCPKGYAPVGEICISASDGDIVLPVAKTRHASAQRVGR